MEEYKGVKFRYRIVEKELPEEQLKKYLDIDARLKEFLDPENNEGNMSLRLEKGFLIKRAGARMTELTKKSVSMIVEIEEIVIAAGAIPSSEARMHNEIYRHHPEANMILHFHDEKMLKSFQGPAIGSFPYGSKELADAAGNLKQKMFMIKDHGFVIIAKDEEELFEMISWIK
jgi:L-fuculose-phosphate aldolase